MNEKTKILLQTIPNIRCEENLKLCSETKKHYKFTYQNKFIGHAIFKINHYTKKISSKVFEPFGNETEKFKGFGLGIYCYKIYLEKLSKKYSNYSFNHQFELLSTDIKNMLKKTKIFPENYLEQKTGIIEMPLKKYQTQITKNFEKTLKEKTKN